jgi:hypothetical protein
MGRYRGQSSNAQQPGHASPSHDAHDRDRTLDEARRHWAVAACERCGRSAVLGEPMTKTRLYDRDVLVCPECLAAPAQPTWVAAPDRHGRQPVPLVAGPQLRPVAGPIEPPDEQAA